MVVNTEICPDPVHYRDVACEVETGSIGENKKLIDKIPNQDIPRDPNSRICFKYRYCTFNYHYIQSLVHI